MTEPFLHLGDVRAVVERVGRRSRPQGVRSHQFHENAKTLGVVHHHVAIDRTGSQGQAVRAGSWPHGAKQRAVGFMTMAGGLQILFQQSNGVRMHGHVADFAALAVHT